MSIYATPFRIILHLIFTTASILQFFLFVRTVLLWKNVAWLIPFDTAGKDLVDGFTTLLDRLCYWMCRRRLSTKGSLIVGLILLEVAKLFTTGIC